MANELTVSASIAYAPSVANQISISRIEEILRITMTGGDHSQGTQVLSTLEEPLDISSDIGTIGMCFIKNLDATNAVEIGLTGSFPFQLRATEFCLFRASGAIFVKASAGTPSFQYLVFEE